jgi:hypothetical protein
MNPGTLSSTLAVQITFVSPNSISTDAAACLVKSRVIVIARSSSGARPLGLSILPSIRPDVENQRIISSYNGAMTLRSSVFATLKQTKPIFNRTIA